MLKYIFTFGRAYYLEEREKYLLKCLDDEIAIISTLELIANECNADKVALVYMHNGGGKIAPGVEKHLKICNEICSNKKLDMKHSHHSTKTDANHIVKMCQMYSSKWQMKLYKFEELCNKIYDSCEIHDKNVRQEILAYVGDNEKYMWYISIQYAGDTLTELNEEMMNSINDNRNKIVTILHDYFKISRKR